VTGNLEESFAYLLDHWNTQLAQLQAELERLTELRDETGLPYRVVTKLDKAVHCVTSAIAEHRVLMRRPEQQYNECLRAFRQSQALAGKKENTDA